MKDKADLHRAVHIRRPPQMVVFPQVRIINYRKWKNENFGAWSTFLGGFRLRRSGCLNSPFVSYGEFALG
jgi:hypothetical protein